MLFLAREAQRHAGLCLKSLIPDLQPATLADSVRALINPLKGVQNLLFELEFAVVQGRVYLHRLQLGGSILTGSAYACLFLDELLLLLVDRLSDRSELLLQE